MRRQGAYRPKATSLESLAISRGIIESPASNHPLVERLRRDLTARYQSNSSLLLYLFDACDIHFFFIANEIEVLMALVMQTCSVVSTSWIVMALKH